MEQRTEDGLSPYQVFARANVRAGEDAGRLNCAGRQDDPAPRLEAKALPVRAHSTHGDRGAPTRLDLAHLVVGENACAERSSAMGPIFG